MFGLTEIQLANEAVVEGRESHKSAMSTTSLRVEWFALRGACWMLDSDPVSALDFNLPKPITHGEWLANQQRERLGAWASPAAQFTQSDINDYERIRSEKGLPSVSTITPRKERGGDGL